MSADTGATAETVRTPELETKTLRGDVRDLILAEFKHIDKPWKASNEEEQQRLIDRASDIADRLVREAVDLVAARGLPALPIEVGKVEVDGAALKGKFEAYADDDNLLRIRHLQGSRAMFVLASPSAFQGEQKPQTPDVIGTLKVPEPDAQAVLDAMTADGHDIPDDVRDLPHNKGRKSNGHAEATA